MKENESMNQKPIKSEEEFFVPRTYAAVDLKSFYASVECLEKIWTP